MSNKKKAKPNNKPRIEGNRYILTLSNGRTRALPPVASVIDDLDAAAATEAMHQGKAGFVQLVFMAFDHLVGDKKAALLEGVKFSEIRDKLIAWGNWAPTGEEPLGESLSSED